MTKLSATLGAALALFAFAGAVWGVAVAWQQHVATEAATCQRVAQVEHILVSEHPSYSESIYYAGAKTCP